MDPNATLDQILDLAKLYATKKSKRGDLAKSFLALDKRAREGIGRKGIEDNLVFIAPWVRERIEYCELASLVDALSVWVLRGGFLPIVWESKK